MYAKCRNFWIRSFFTCENNYLHVVYSKKCNVHCIFCHMNPTNLYKLKYLNHKCVQDPVRCAIEETLCATQLRQLKFTSEVNLQKLIMLSDSLSFLCFSLVPDFEPKKEPDSCKQNRFSLPFFI